MNSSLAKPPRVDWSAARRALRGRLRCWRVPVRGALRV